MTIVALGQEGYTDSWLTVNWQHADRDRPIAGRLHVPPSHRAHPEMHWIQSTRALVGFVSHIVVWHNDKEAVCSSTRRQGQGTTPLCHEPGLIGRGGEFANASPRKGERPEGWESHRGPSALAAIPAVRKW